MVSQIYKIFPIILAAIIGGLWGISSSPNYLHAIIFIPIIWSIVENRWTAGLVPAVYVLVATRGLINGSEVFFDRGIYFGVTVWLAAALPHYFVGVIAWQRKHKRQLLIGIPLFCILSALPPVMLVGWAHPLLAAGIWFPHFGTWSILLCLMFMLLVADMVHHFRPWQFALVTLVVMQSILLHKEPTINKSNTFHSHNTHFPIGVYGSVAPSPMQILQRHWQMQAMIHNSPEGSIHVFPESVAGYWDDFIKMSWQSFLRQEYPDKTVLIGAYKRSHDKNEGLIIAVSAKSARTIYTQRVPMTGGMYNPFAKESFEPNWLAPTIAEINGVKAGFAICFEHIVFLPMLQVAIANPDVVIAPASIWWAPKQLRNAQQQSLRLWALWLNTPIIESINGDINDQ